MSKHKFPYKWYLKDGYPLKNGLKVFGTFICGGGSTMGYKLAGFEHLGGVEIDPPIADVYKTNHNPKYLFVEDIREFAKRNEYPEELYNLDILDGSPPCSSFSMAGNREKDWGKTKVFREGQAEQRLDDLFFDYIKLAKKLQPKVVIAENVKGIIQGNAKVYSKNIVKKMIDAGYNVQVFCLNAASMGVPQKRERVFFIGHKKEYSLPKLKLEFNETKIKYKELKTVDGTELKMSELVETYWNLRQPEDKRVGDTYVRLGMKDQRFGDNYVLDERTPMTITSGGAYYREDTPTTISITDFKLIGSFPLDYNFINNSLNNTKYVIGMSVPPVMTAQIANQIKIQWLDKIQRIDREYGNFII
jgi:DNA (cytosine-5)-methyltransferase 1